MRAPPNAPSVFGKAIAASLRAIRKSRRLGQNEIAAAIGVSRRSYVALEGGAGRLSLDQLVAFADATDSDRMALVAAILSDKPSVAVQCADNKLMAIMVITADDFEAASAGRMADFRPQEIFSAFEGAFARLEADLDRRQAAERLLTRRLSPPPVGDED